MICKSSLVLSRNGWIKPCNNVEIATIENRKITWSKINCTEKRDVSMLMSHSKYHNFCVSMDTYVCAYSSFYRENENGSILAKDIKPKTIIETRLGIEKKQTIKENPFIPFLESNYKTSTLKPQIFDKCNKGRSIIQWFSNTGKAVHTRLYDYSYFGEEQFNLIPFILSNKVYKSMLCWHGRSVVSNRNRRIYNGVHEFPNYNKKAIDAIQLAAISEGRIVQRLSETCMRTYPNRITPRASYKKSSGMKEIRSDAIHIKNKNNNAKIPVYLNGGVCLINGD